MAEDYTQDPNLTVLAQEIETGKCVVFLGAGISIAAGLPSWADLVRLMRARARLTREYSNLRTADLCRQVLGARAFTELIAKEIGRVRDPGILHTKISQLPVSLFATTNFDQLLERSLRTTRGADPRVLSLHEPGPWRYIPESPAEPWVLKVHGCIGHSRDRLILSEDDLLSFSTAYEQVERGLGELLARRPVLFLGYSLTDWDLLNALHQLRFRLGDDTPNGYFVGYGLELPERRFLEQRYGLRTFDVAGNHATDQTAAWAQFLDDVMEHFQIPLWIRRLATELGGHVDGRPGILDDPLTTIFPDFDVTAASRFIVRVQWELGVDLPIEKIIGEALTIREFLALTRTQGDRST
ncbi:SIR2 family protein [Actinoplanes sp. L3-i22]|uniref:SIR2 family NAD-dependent protein deacylase n=1 Tax=Actinoplanes sp. L3-i22 TaxID=2836373 RepID=UPI001C76C6F6|nr:SIR2 family protein [Actinoplanes sp. L3-i22]BCY11304.1 hypothetical protein L3i22_063920 [Actinoplanes sp. L3-i22]